MIYYVEDDANIRELVVYTLTQTGMEAQGFEDAAAFDKAMAEKRPDAVLLDIMLPGESGLHILKKLRADDATSSLPIILITAKDTEYDKVTGLDLGADDYIAKPFGMMELVARVRALLRRSAPKASPDVLSSRGLSLDKSKHTVTADGADVRLTYKEFELLRLLMENPGKVFSRDRLLSDIWGYDYDGGTRTVDAHVRTLRMKLGNCGDMVETVRNVGYRFGGEK